MRKLAKISALLAAMALALAFAGCKSDDDDTEYWISVEKEDGGTEYADSYIEFTSDTTATLYSYYDEDDVEDKDADTVGYHKKGDITFETSGDTSTVTAFKNYQYDDKKSKWVSNDANMNEGSITLKITGTEMTVTMTYGGETQTTDYKKVDSKPAKPTYTSASM